jgi:predicted O-methyltransferase YrrM
MPQGLQATIDQGQDALSLALAKGQRLGRRILMNRRELARLRDSAPRPAGPALAAALRRARDEAVDPDERAAIGRIEALRAAQGRSIETVAVPLDLDGDPAHAGQVEQRVVGEISRAASRSPRSAQVLFQVARGIRPERALEMGTCLGISAAYVGAALDLNGRGRLVTLEGVPGQARIAGENLAGLGLADRVEIVLGPFQETLGAALEAAAPLQFAFVDGDHREDATLAYYEQMLPHLSDGAVVVFDDIRWSDGMTRAWSRLTAHPRTRFAIDLYNMGLCIVGEGRRGPPEGRRGPAEIYRLALE